MRSSLQVIKHSLHAGCEVISEFINPKPTWDLNPRWHRCHARFRVDGLVTCEVAFATDHQLLSQILPKLTSVNFCHLQSSSLVTDRLPAENRVCKCATGSVFVAPNLR